MRMLGDQPEIKRKRIRLRYVVPVLVAAPFIAVGVAVAVVASSKASIRIGGNCGCSAGRNGMRG